MSTAQLIAENQARWQKMRVTGAVTSIDAVARRLCAPAAKARFMAVSKRTGVPWSVIAVIDERETSENWNLSIAQGDHWNEVSRHVPTRRGPFKSWEDAAVDALVQCAPHAAANKDWSAGGTLALLERYNGLGYANRCLPSPYIWASTDQYVRGKYTSDDHYEAKVVDHQIGCAALLKRMSIIDPSIASAIENHGRSAA